MTPSFKKSNFVNIVKSLVPEIGQGDPDNIQSQQFPNLKSVVLISDKKEQGMIRFNDLYRRYALADDHEMKRREELIDPDDPTNIQFTSGTTGYPKGATLTHHGIINNAKFCGINIKLTNEDKICIPVPLYHCLGMVLGNLLCVNKGATMVYPSEGFDAYLTMKAAEEEKCTGLLGVPTMFYGYLEQQTKHKLEISNLRTGIIAGAICPEILMKRLVDELNLRDLSICYGQTECSPVTTQTLTSDSLTQKTTTVGRVHPHVELKVVDSKGSIVPRGVEGEICARGYGVMLKYWKDEERTMKVKKSSGWIHSGDLGLMDKDGYIQVLGRIDDMIIRGGENIYPAEIEEFLSKHPKISEIQVVGVKSSKLGEEVCAWIKLRENQYISRKEIKEYCKGEIAHFKIPKYIKFVKEFPLTITGKVRKNVMREVTNKILLEKSEEIEN